MNLIELFQPNFKNRADQPAIAFKGQWLTFRDLDAKSDVVAAALINRHGLKKGDRAGMYIDNSFELVLFYLACLKVGAIVVPLNLLYRERELMSLLGDAEPKVLLTDSPRYEVLEPLRGRLGFIEQVFVAGAVDGDATLSFAQLTSGTKRSGLTASIGGEDPALMLYTSGTTGRSKGAVLTHHNLASNITVLLHCWQWTADDRFVLALPMFHAHGLCNGLHGAIASGCRTFIFERFKATDVLQTLREQRGTLFFGVPTMYERLLEAADDGFRLPQHMRLYVSGSAPLAPDTFVRFYKMFGHEILERYGMSETLMITSNLYGGPRRQGTVGKPLPGVQVRVVGQDGSVITAAKDVGEIQVRGPNVLKHYWRQTGKTKASFDHGWFKTGDLGRFDEEGRLIICGRTKQLIISGGFNIYPQELINCICDHCGVADAAVIGVPDKVRGEVVKAYVVKAEPELTADEVMEHCRNHLASFKVPRRVVFLDALPRNAMGKVQLRDLPQRDRL